MSRYLPDLTKAELLAIHGFLKGREIPTEEELDEFMRDSYKKYKLFENCVAHVTRTEFSIKRPIGWANED
jgi:hypothetical protein